MDTKKNDRSPWQEAAQLLPKEAGSELVYTVLNDIYDAGLLGPDLLLFQRQGVEVAEDIARTMSPEDWDRRERTARRRWGAHCTCTACGDDFIAGYIGKNGLRGIVVTQGEDGQTYSGYAEPGENTIEVFEGDCVLCPCCGTPVELIAKAELAKGRTYQALQAEAINVDRYSVLMYWMVRRHIDSTGRDMVQILPYAALLIGLDGRLHRFRTKRLGWELRDVAWIPCARSRDPMQMPYYCWGAANNRNIGGWCLGAAPRMEGQTGEKTALELYIGAGGHWPGAYLHVWQAHPNVENLMRQGFSHAVCAAIDDALDRAEYWRDLNDAPPIPWIDWRDVKPHRMLGMDKTAFRAIKQQLWSRLDMETWDRYRRQISGADAGVFTDCRAKVGSAEIGKLLEMVAAGWEDLTPQRVVRYLEREGMLDGGVQHLIDYRKMLRDAEMEETPETRWPRDLMAAHERLTEYWSAKTRVSYQKGFTTAFIRYRDLAWTDGELCIVIPSVESDLIAEGKTLRHCVGTYGSAHCSGRPIFFVRKYRRPERSYYTLQINMLGDRPTEVQLHGYGNEHHGEHKQYRHKIPRKVRDFCDRWEREVLAPWFAAQRGKENETVKLPTRQEGAA